jgi:hypothetical protein
MAFVNTGDRRHDLSRRAVTALQCVVVNECLLHRVKLSIRRRKAFDGHQFTPIGLNRRRKTRNYPVAIQVNGTGTTLSVVASLLCTSKTQSFSYKVKQ